MKRALFLDRDGVINRRIVGGYVRSWEEFELLPGITETLPAMHAAGWFTVLVTNQRGIALGQMSERDLLEIHERMQQELRRQCGHELDAIYYCPHEKGDACGCRKPQPGMLLDAARDNEINLSASWMIGDSESDIEAGRGAGCGTIRIADADEPTAADHHVRSLLEAWSLIAGFV
ncbi:MAG: HAD family hydrolase [Bacteroidetes bacterium]|nr:HAD family hydrolase [Bacteroidota bacterium]